MTMRLRLFCLWILGALATGCADRRALIIESADLLEKPYPVAYPGIGPNPVLAHLRDTRVCILDDSYGKDFHVFRVRTTTGQVGYIIHTSGVKETDEPCHNN